MANEDKATRYQRLRRRATVAGVAAVALVLSLAQWVGPPGLMVPVESAGLLSQFSALALAAFGLLVVAVGATFPSALYRDALLARHYALSRESPASWVKEWAKHAAVTVAIGAVSVWACALARSLAPQWWWALGGIGAAIAPFVIGRIVSAAWREGSTGTPLGKGALRDGLTRLLAKAGLPDVGLCETHVGGRTRLASAAVVSVGGERRVVLSDTLLADHTDEEVEVVVAHELAHVVHHDAVASQAALALHVSVSLLGADVALRWTGAEPVILPSRLLPLALLATGAAFLVLRPLMLAVSRHQERLADRYALTLTGNAPALQSVLRRMAANNLAEPAPSRGTVWWFHSHPAASERMPGSGHPTR